MLGDEYHDIGRSVAKQVERASKRCESSGESRELHLLERPWLKACRFTLESCEYRLQ